MNTISSLTVLADPLCPLCRRVSQWLSQQPQLVPLEVVPVASAQARQRFPHLDHEQTLRTITVVADTGEYWQEGAAYVMCLWALADYRHHALRLTGPAGFAAAKAIAQTAANVRLLTANSANSVDSGESVLGRQEVTAVGNYAECRDGSCS